MASCLVASRPWGMRCRREVQGAVCRGGTEAGGGWRASAMEWHGAPAGEVQLQGWAQEGYTPSLVRLRGQKCYEDERREEAGAWLVQVFPMSCRAF